jgi:hypothetical protein
MVPAPMLAPRADDAVAEVREVVGLGARPSRLLRLDEVADVRLFADVALRPQVRERARPARARPMRESVATEYGFTTAPSPTSRS